MTESPFEILLQSIERTAPRPWYPSEFAQVSGIPRDRLDAPLDQLRVAGLIGFTPWVAGKGQGYELTPHGTAVLKSPRTMLGLRRGYLPAAREMEPDDGDMDPHLAGTALERGEVIIRSLRNRSKPQLTRALIIVNLIVFGAAVAIMMKNNVPLNQALLGGNLAALQASHQTGSVTGEDILNGQWWRLLTCCFVHHGALHLAMNMYSLWVLGTIVENLWGQWRFLVIYALSGLCGSCAAMWFTPESNLAGASGAIWGLMASYPVWLILNRAYLPSRLVSEALRALLPVIFLNVFISFIPGISKEAHFAGGAIGAVVAALLNLHRFGRDPVRWVWIGLVGLIPVVCVGALIQASQGNPRWIKEAKALAAQKRDLTENEEVDDFNANHIKVISAARERAAEAIEDANTLRTQFAPNRRPKAQLAEVLGKLKVAGDEIDAATRHLESARPYDSERIRMMMSEAIKGFAKLKAFVELYEQCLNDGEKWPAADDDKFERASQHVVEAWSKYDENIVRQPK